MDIEKEVALGGPIHSKGVLILAGFLGQRFASERPLSLAASLVFEQSYSGVEGDSASCGELVALLSALGEVPVRQGRAITGSVNQHGQVQPIGGVNEKIEGFFDVCRASGLTGDQGVLIPASNVKHLMLRADVVEAAEKGQFHVWPIETVDEAVELLTGVPAGERGADGRYPEGSVNRRVDDRLAAFAEKARNFGRGVQAAERREGGGGPEAAGAPAPGTAPAGAAGAAPRPRAAGLRWARPGAAACSPDSCSSRSSGGRPGPRSASASSGVPPFTGVALRFALAGALLLALAPRSSASASAAPAASGSSGS